MVCIVQLSLCILAIFEHFLESLIEQIMITLHIITQ